MEARIYYLLNQKAQRELTIATGNSVPAYQTVEVEITPENRVVFMTTRNNYDKRYDFYYFTKWMTGEAILGA